MAVDIAWNGVEAKMLAYYIMGSPFNPSSKPKLAMEITQMWIFHFLLGRQTRLFPL